MKMIVFSKMFKSEPVAGLIKLAHDSGFEGYDLCVRPGYVVNPDNVTKALPEAVRQVRQAGLDIPMVTGDGDLLTADDPTAAPILAAMDKSDVRLIKLGYYRFDPLKQDYWTEVDRIRKAFDGWQALGRKYGVKICYHTHSHRCMGLNCAALAHLVRGFDPQYIGAYIDPGHMALEGEEFCVGAAMVRNHLSIVAVKDVNVGRQVKNGHGARTTHWVPAGEGIVDWTAVFGELARLKYNGPMTVHCEFEVPPEAFLETMRREVKFFNAQRAAALSPAQRPPAA